MKIKCIFAWYDLWVGLFIDRKKKRVYFFPVPCFGIVFEQKVLSLKERAANTPHLDQMLKKYKQQD